MEDGRTNSARPSNQIKAAVFTLAGADLAFQRPSWTMTAEHDVGATASPAEERGRETLYVVNE